MSVELLVGENIDRLITVEVSLVKGLPYGVAAKLYDCARRKLGGPLTLLAADKLLSSVEEDSFVFILTGTMIPPWFTAETDGPIGAVVLARAIRVGLNAFPIIIVDDAELTLKVMRATCRANELNVVDVDDLERISNSVAILPFPLGEVEAKDFSRNLIDRFNPSALIAIEKLGMNVKGVYHTALGHDCSKWEVKADYLVDEARNKGVLTIGIGDHGNEIGFGLIYDEAREIVPHGMICQCPCKSGITCITEVDVLIPATISNWGAYGVSACLAYLKNDFSLIHNGVRELYLIEECVRAGGIDGGTSMPSLSVDTVPASINAHIVDILRNLVESTVREISRHF